MKSLFRASILGLGHSEVVSIRQHVAAILEDKEVDWVGANHENLDFLIVNSSFINASSVQNLLRNKAMPVLLTSHASDKQIDDQKVMRLPLIENTHLKSWIHECVLNHRAIIIPQAKLQDSVITQVLLDNSKIFQYLSHCSDGLLHLSDSCGALGIVDTTNQLIYLLPERRVPVDMQGHLTYEPVSNLPKAHQSVDLLQWLWDVSWVAPSCAVFVSSDQLVKLKFWPQPVRATDRKDVLLMSAKLAQDVMCAQQLAIDLKIPLLRAQHFISALVMVGFAEKYSEIYQKPPTLPEKKIDTEETSGIRRLLMGVRKRLGL